MFNMTGSEIVVILLVALVVLGPEKLPDAIRRFGRTYAEFKRMSSGFQSEFRSVLEEPVREMRDTADMLGRATEFKPASVEEPTPPTAPDTSTDATTDTSTDTTTDTSTDTTGAPGTAEETASSGASDPSDADTGRDSGPA